MLTDNSFQVVQFYTVNVEQKIHPGENVGRGGDDTLFAKVDGIVRFERKGRDKKKYLYIQ